MIDWLRRWLTVRQLKRHVTDWSKGRDDVRDVMFCGLKRFWMVGIVNVAVRYNESLEDAASDLDIALANDPRFASMNISVQVIPGFDDAQEQDMFGWSWREGLTGKDDPW